ncbi:17027_t:CDS:1, partial [Acaulospora morrowiae]
EAIENSFPVDIRSDMTVGHLKKLIKEEAEFDIPANKLMLWK